MAQPNKKLVAVLIICLLSCIFSVSSIHKSENGNGSSLVDLNALAERALQIIGEKVDTAGTYETLAFVSTTDTLVYFYAPIKYVPEDTMVHYDLLIDIDDSTYNPKSGFINPDGYQPQSEHILFDMPPYNLTESDKKQIKIVNNAFVKKGKSLETYTGLHNDVVIEESDSLYHIEFRGIHTKSWRYIDKKSGELLNDYPLHAHTKSTLLPCESYFDSPKYKLIR